MSPGRIRKDIERIFGKVTDRISIKMKVLHICGNYGTPLYREITSRLAERGIDQYVIYPRRSENIMAENAHPQIVLDSPLMLNILTKVSFSFKRRLLENRFADSIAGYMPDIVHAHTLFSDGSLAYSNFRKTGIPYIVAVRSTDTDVFFRYRPWLRNLAGSILSSAAAVIFISPVIKNKTEAFIGENISIRSEVIPNGIDDIFHSQQPVTRHLVREKPVLFYAGTFQRRKNVEELIRFAKSNNLNLRIAGHGGSRERSVIRKSGKVSSVDYLGAISSRNHLIEEYRNADIFIMPSRRETFGLVYIEAISQGTPVIYSEGTGIDGFFERGEIGCSVDPNDQSGWMQALEYILNNYQAISANCIKRAAEFTWRSVADRYEQIYKTTAG